MIAKSKLHQVLKQELLALHDGATGDAALDSETMDWFVDRWAKMFRLGCKKMVNGQKQYRSKFLKDVDHLEELDMEIVDAIHYAGAAQFAFAKRLLNTK